MLFPKQRDPLDEPRLPHADSQHAERAGQRVRGLPLHRRPGPGRRLRRARAHRPRRVSLFAVRVHRLRHGVPHQADRLATRRRRLRRAQREVLGIWFDEPRGCRARCLFAPDL